MNSVTNFIPASQIIFEITNEFFDFKQNEPL
jgi:hypothetical protein